MMSIKQQRPYKVEAKPGFSSPLVAGALVTVLSGLAGCSSLPDTVNPAEWYHSTVDFFAGEDGDSEVNQGKQEVSADETPITGANKGFPELSSVPERPSTSVQLGLVADIDKRKYAEPIARQGEAMEILAAKPPAVPPSPSPEQVSTTMISPIQSGLPAMPVAPVVQTPTSMPQVLTSMPQAPTSVSQAPAPSNVGSASIVPNSINLTAPPSTSPMPANAMASINEDSFGTVVVSSMGIDMESVAPALKSAVVDAQTLSTGVSPSAPANLSGIKVATILFETGSAGLNKNDRRILDEVFHLHQQRGGTVTVVGHASSRTRNMDPVKHKMVNYSVSVDRADRIAKELRSMGMAPDMIVVDARADNMPLYNESMPSGEAGNRRAEIYFHN